MGVGFPLGLPPSIGHPAPVIEGPPQAAPDLLGGVFPDIKYPPRGGIIATVVTLIQAIVRPGGLS